MKTKLIVFFISFNLFLVLVACQTTPPSKLKEFDEVHLGAEKIDVLEKIGNPTFFDRKLGQDRWTYQMYEDNIRHEKVIYFLDGFVTYRGEPIPPFISAEEQDDINYEKNIILDLADAKSFSEHKLSSQKVPLQKSK